MSYFKLMININTLSDHDPDAHYHFIILLSNARPSYFFKERVLTLSALKNTW